MIKVKIDDGFQSELVAHATFKGYFEIPAINKPNNFIPSKIVPFTKMKYAEKNDAIGFFEMDLKFANVLKNPENYVAKFKSFDAIISPDFSLYRDAPFYVQLLNICRSRIISHYFQMQGVNVLPLVRWGSPDTYTKNLFGEAIAFTGIPHNSTIVVSTYGCIKSKDDKFHFAAGLYECMQTLTPKIVLVYGAMPNKIFEQYFKYAKFHHYKDWISIKKEGENG